MPGPDPEAQSYGSFASFSDPDGNDWLLQEVTTRLPGRVEEPDIAALAGLLLETAWRTAASRRSPRAHDWWDWYAPYFSARRAGRHPGAGDRRRRPLHEGGARCGSPMTSTTSWRSRGS